MSENYSLTEGLTTYSMKNSYAGFPKVDLEDDTIVMHKSTFQVYLRVFIVISGSYSLGYSWIIYNQLYHTIAPVYKIPEE